MTEEDTFMSSLFGVRDVEVCTDGWGGARLEDGERIRRKERIYEGGDSLEERLIGPLWWGVCPLRIWGEGRMPMGSSSSFSSAARGSQFLHFSHIWRMIKCTVVPEVWCRCLWRRWQRILNMNVMYCYAFVEEFTTDRFSLCVFKSENIAHWKCKQSTSIEWSHGDGISGWRWWW